MMKSIKSSTVNFNKSKNICIVALIFGFITWHVGFISIGGEWFAMWESQIWNGEQAAFRISIVFLTALIFITMNNDHLKKI